MFGQWAYLEIGEEGIQGRKERTESENKVHLFPELAL